MSDDLSIKYPITIEIQVHMSNGNQFADATVKGPIGRVPTHDEILQIISDVRAASVQYGFSIIESPQQLIDMQAAEIFGTRVHVPIEETEFCYAEDELPPPRQRPSACDDDEDGDY